MLIRATSLSARALSNMSEISLATSSLGYSWPHESALEPESVLEMESTLCADDDDDDEGFGGGCKIARPGSEAYNSMGRMRKLTAVKPLLVVAQAFASIVAALSMPHAGRVDWHGTSDHMEELLAPMQESQGLATDHDP